MKERQVGVGKENPVEKERSGGRKGKTPLKRSEVGEGKEKPFWIRVGKERKTPLKRREVGEGKKKPFRNG